MVKVMYNDQLVYKVFIWAFFGISLWEEKLALTTFCTNKVFGFWNDKWKYSLCMPIQNMHSKE